MEVNKSGHDRALDSATVTTSTRVFTGGNVGAMVLMAIAITAVINYLAAQPRFQVSFDWTSSGANTLSDKSLQLLVSLPARLGEDKERRERAIEFVSFLEMRAEDPAEGKAVRMVHDLLDVYKTRSGGRVVFSKINPNLDPGAAMAKVQSLKIKDATPALFMSFDGRFRTLQLEDLVRIQRMGGGMVGGGGDSRIVENRIEESVTSNLLALIEDARPKVYFVTGHGEPDLNDPGPEGFLRFSNALTQVGYDVAMLDLTEKGGVPADARVVIWIGQERPVPASEFAALKAHAHRGGRFIVAMDPTRQPGMDADLCKFLGEYSIKSPEGIICEPVFDPLTGGSVMGLPNCAESVSIRPNDFSSAHPVTRGFFEKRIRLPFPAARPFERIVEGASKGLVEDLGRTGTRTWLDTVPYNFTVDKDRESHAPMTVLAAATLPNDTDPTASAPADEPDSKRSREGRLIAVGTSLLARNDGFAGGRDLYLSAVEWLAGREFAAGIGPRPLRENPQFDGTVALPRIIGITLLLGGAAIAMAGTIWYLRRGVRLALFFGLGAGAFPILIGILKLFGAAE